jgi:hypothetical protein
MHPVNSFAQLGQDISHLFQDIHTALQAPSGGGASPFSEIIHDATTVLHDIVGIINHPPSESISFSF